MRPEGPWQRSRACHGPAHGPTRPVIIGPPFSSPEPPDKKKRRNRRKVHSVRPAPMLATPPPPAPPTPTQTPLPAPSPLAPSSPRAQKLRVWGGALALLPCRGGGGVRHPLPGLSLLPADGCGWAHAVISHRRPIIGRSTGRALGLPCRFIVAFFVGPPKDL